MPPLAGSLLLAGASLAFTLVLFEAGFRAYAGFEDNRTLEAAVRRPPRVTPGGVATLGGLVRLSRHADIVYELQPRLRVRFLGAPLTTSSAGFRDKEYPLEKPPGVVRIVGLGDSVMFGWGVGDGEDYLSLLEWRLGEAKPDRRYEVINTAVPGYNGVMEVETLKQRGLAYRPDLVIVGFCGNDMGLPNFLGDRQDTFALDRSFLVDFVRGRLSPEARTRDDGLVGRPGRVSWRNPDADELARVPPRYAHMVGLRAYARAMQELRRLQESDAFEALVLYFPGAPPEVRDAVAGAGLQSFNMAPLVKRFIEEHGGRREAFSVLHVSGRDPHPSRLGHRFIADALFDQLRETGLLERLGSRPERRPAEP